jgi:Flp pilus assembly protein TadD
VLQNGELRFRRNAKPGGDYEANSWSSADAILGFTQTRRDILAKFSSALALAVANFLGSGSNEPAEAAVSQRVKLKDVENQKLQDALRAAVVGDLENAENLFTEIIKEEPSSASGWSNRGSVRISLGKYELATEDFTKAIELAPEAPVPFLNRAISYEVRLSPYS